MGGFFGCIASNECVNDLFYGTDYNSHLGTKRAGLVTFDPERGFNRSIHSLERDYFRSRFEDELDSFHGIRDSASSAIPTLSPSSSTHT